MDRNKPKYSGQYLDMWANILQRKEQGMEEQAPSKRIAELEYKVRILEQRLAGQDERIREAVREMAHKVTISESHFGQAMQELSLNVPSLLMFLDLKKQVEDFQEEAKQNIRLLNASIQERLGE